MIDVQPDLQSFKSFVSLKHTISYNKRGRFKIEMASFVKDGGCLKIIYLVKRPVIHPGE